MALLTVIYHLPLPAARVASVAPGNFLDCRVEVLAILCGLVAELGLGINGWATGSGVVFWPRVKSGFLPFIGIGPAACQS